MARLIGYSARNAARIRDTVRYVDTLRHDQTGQRRRFVTSYKAGGDAKAGTITAVTGSSTSAVYDAISNDGTLEVEDATPVNRPFGTNAIIAAVIGAPCWLSLADDGETVLLDQRTEVVDPEDCA